MNTLVARPSTKFVSMTLEALTTTFTPARSCLGDSNIWQLPYLQAVYYLQGPPSISYSGCLPPSYRGSEFTFYYPGICPSGYTSACTSVKSLGTYTVTVQICCPTSGFQCQSQLSYYWQTTLGCFTPFNAHGILSVTVSTAGIITVSAVTVDTTDAVNAYAIAIQTSVLSTNKGILNTGSPTSGPTSLAITNPTTSATSATTDPTRISQTSSRPISGAAETQPSGPSAMTGAAIGLGILMGIAIIFMIGFYWGTKQRRASKNAGEIYELPGATIPP
ncbi:hypothetical protein V8E54_007138 [Elaphomyces granulatus]